MAIEIISINLYSDWIDIVKSELRSQGYQTEEISDDELSILYFALQKKLIRPMQRSILKSDVFTCPEELIDGLELIEEKINNGDDLKPHLSRKLKRLNDQDGLLFDWGIYHLHLGIEMQADGFIKRTGPLLYARFDNRNAYFINVVNHGAWTTQELLRTIHRNWPASIEEYKLKGVIGVENAFADNDIKHLRNAQVNTLIEIEPGVVYMGPGGGLAASGDSMESVMMHIQNKKSIEKLEESLKDNTEVFLSGLFTSLEFITNSELEFKLKKESGRYYIEETNNNFKLLLNE